MDGGGGKMKESGRGKTSFVIDPLVYETVCNLNGRESATIDGLQDVRIRPINSTFRAVKPALCHTA